MANDTGETLVEKWIRRCKNQPLLALIIFSCIVVGGAASLSDSVGRLRKFFGDGAPTPPASSASTTTPDSAETYAELMSLERRRASLQASIEEWEHTIQDLKNAADILRAKLNSGTLSPTELEWVKIMLSPKDEEERQNKIAK